MLDEEVLHADTPQKFYEAMICSVKTVPPPPEADSVRYGEWKRDPFGDWMCPYCGCCPADWEPKPGNEYGLPPYCHGCGAKLQMR